MNLVADPNFVRAWPGGCGYAKMGSNYAPTMWTQVRYSYLTSLLKYIVIDINIALKEH